MGRFATGNRALGFSSGFAVNVGNDEPGPQRIMACSPGEGAEIAWGMVSEGTQLVGVRKQAVGKRKSGDPIEGESNYSLGDGSYATHCIHKKKKGICFL